MIAILIEAAVRAVALALVTALVLALLRIRNIPAQRTAWMFVLLSAIAMPALMRSPWVPLKLTWTPSLPTFRSAAPVRPQPTAIAGPQIISIHDATPVPLATASLTPGYVPPSTVEPAKFPISAGRMFLIIYGLITCALLARLFLGLFTAARLWSRSAALPEFSAPRFQVRASDAISSPVTVLSGVLLPANYRSWDAEKLRIVLAHERSHVRHHDFHLQFLAGLYTAIFWFSPLGWWLRRRLSTLGEAISDHAGLTVASTRTEYAEIVLHFAAMPRRPLTGVAMASSGNISRRIEQLLNHEAHHRAFTEGRYRAWLAFLLLPCMVFAAGMLVRVPSASAAQSQVVPPAEAPPAPEAAPEAPPAPPAEPDETTSSHSQDTVTIHQSSTNERGHSERHGYSYGFSDGGDSYAIVDGSSRNLNMSGNWSDAGDINAEIDRARRMANGKFLWFRHGGKSYVVSDPAIVNELQALYKPMEELGRQQEELGKQQEALGREQERLGNMQEKATVSAPDLSRELAALNAATAKLNAAKGKELSQEEIADLQEKIGDLQGKLGEIQGKIGEKQGSFGAEQGKLGEKQGKLGEQQGRLGEQQGKLAQQADRKVRVVIQQSLTNGKARPVE